MQHSFDVDIAKKYGILEAVLLNNMQFWIEKNKANKVNYFDGLYWTYNSIKAFSELFPYVSQKQIGLALKHLIDEGILKTGNYNKSSYDRTLWYAITEKGKCIFPGGKMDLTCRENGFDLEGKPIPYINTDINTDIKYIEEKKETIFDYLQENGFTLTPIHYEIVGKWEDNELTRYAIQVAVLNNIYKISYIDKIIYNFKVNNITTIEQAKELKYKNNYQKIETDAPEWFNKEQNLNKTTEEEKNEIDEILKRLGG